MRRRRRTAPALTLDRMEAALALEARRGHDNRACVGGTDGLVLAWLAPARDRARTIRTRRRFEAMVAAWEAYRDVDRRRRASVVASTRRVLGDMGAPAEGALTAASPVARLGGVGPARAFALSAMGVLTVEDLLLLPPARYIDTAATAQVAALVDGEQAVIDVALLRNPRAFSGRRASRAEARAGDGTGEIMLVWFNQPYRADQFSVGDRVRVMGKATTRDERRFFLVARTLGFSRADDGGVAAPVTVGGAAGEDADGDGAGDGLLAEYAAPQNLPAAVLRAAIAEALATCAGGLPAVVPGDAAAAHGLITRPEVFVALHRPRDAEQADAAGRSLAFERLYVLQTRLLRHRRRAGAAVPESRVGADGMAAAVEKLAGLRLTGAQRRVIGEIEGDLASDRPACRLIHGDVGCGKTLVAAAALLAAARAGRQAALMAPTEMLAEQHGLRLSALFEAAGVDVHLLTGSLAAGEKAPALAAAGEGRPGVWVGTHALIQKRVAFRDLAVVVVDEQHRFGVAQRARLAAKGCAPNFLAMSATPIPRTLALALYADFDLSVIDELPPGRRPVETRVLPAAALGRAYQALRAVLERGQQGFVVCPLIGPSPAVEAAAAEELAEELRAGALAGLELGLVHGRMPAAERQAVMEAFYAGALRVLVSTTVIEVGLDVPDASVILVNNAERFGLAQLHQLRGRVARSRHRPLCLLVQDSAKGDAGSRLAVLARTEDGFKIAEADLELRGAGELAGLRQHGMGDWLIGDVLRRPELLFAAHDEAAAVIEADPELEAPDHAALGAALRDLGELEEGGWAL